MSAATNRKAPGKHVCLTVRALLHYESGTVRAGETTVRYIKETFQGLPSNKGRHFWDFYSSSKIIQFQKKIMKSFPF